MEANGDNRAERTLLVARNPAWGVNKGTASPEAYIVKNSTWCRLVMMGEFNSGVVWLHAAEGQPTPLRPGDATWGSRISRRTRLLHSSSRFLFSAGWTSAFEPHCRADRRGDTPHQRPGGYHRDERGQQAANGNM